MQMEKDGHDLVIHFDTEIQRKAFFRWLADGGGEYSFRESEESEVYGADAFTDFDYHTKRANSNPINRVYIDCSFKERTNE